MGTSDTANCVAAIEGTSTLYGAHAATNSMAFTVNTAPWTSASVGIDGTATAMGFAEASAGTYTVRADYPGDSYYSAMHATATITVGSTPSSTGVYNYSITGPSGSGYDPTGNISAYADSINGQWTLGYDSLNRVQAASSSPAIKPGTPYLCWSYDAFGNRKQQYFGSNAFSGGGTSACSGGGSTVATQDQGYSSNNRLVSDSTISTSFTYDASGNMTSDGSGGHQYAYDAEGRVCAMSTGISPIYYWGYLYDAEGHRVAKGSISSLDCSLVNGDSFAVTEYYVIGPDGAPMTVLDGSGNWKHTDVPAGPGTMAVYDGDGLHFRLSDWLGTHRVQTDYKGDTPVEDTYQSLPFGELLGSSAGATQKHFTGKERDDESGLDYFGARYYGSTFGRWTVPDWSAKVEPVPYSVLQDPQSLNLYSYVRNHPISALDTDGHGICPISMCGGQFYPPNVAAAQKDPAAYEAAARNTLVGMTALTAGAAATPAVLGSATVAEGMTAAGSLCYQYCSTVGNLIADALNPNPGTPSYSSMGSWVNEAVDGRSAQAIAYEAQITGSAGKAFLVNGVRFDGVSSVGLLEAKGPTYEKLLNESFGGGVASKLLKQARSQVEAARGAPITWSFAEQGAANTMRALFKRQGVKGINVVYTAPK